MKARLRKYQPDQDFLRIHDMLSETFAAQEGLINWDITRWNYARYLVAPYMICWQFRAGILRRAWVREKVRLLLLDEAILAVEK